MVSKVVRHIKVPVQVQMDKAAQLAKAKQRVGRPRLRENRFGEPTEFTDGGFGATFADLILKSRAGK